MRDLGIADRLREAGLVVEEQPGWQTRGRIDGFQPEGVMWHHTAAGLGKDAPSLGVVTNGRADLPGPLCQVLITRSNICLVIASGRANHAGTGTGRGVKDRGNSTKYGIEVENTGYNSTEPWRLDQLFVLGKATAALIGYDAGRVAECCMHKEYTSRKIDMHTVSGADMRLITTEFCRQWHEGQVPPPPTPIPIPVPAPVGDLVAVAAAIAAASKQIVKQGSKGEAAKWAQILLNNKLGGADLMVDGNFGPASAAATRIFQRNTKAFFRLNDSQMKVDGIIGPATWFWLTR
jgi:hypothetical protein